MAESSGLHEKELSLPGVYTVEAAAVFSICMILLGSAIILGYEVYRESLKAAECSEMEYDAVKAFRLSEAGEEFIGRIRR